MTLINLPTQNAHYTCMKFNCAVMNFMSKTLQTNDFILNACDLEDDA